MQDTTTHYNCIDEPIDLCLFSRAKAKWERTGFSGRRLMCMLSENPDNCVVGGGQDSRSSRWAALFHFICSRISHFWSFPHRGKKNIMTKKKRKWEKQDGNYRYIYNLHLIIPNLSERKKIKAVFCMEICPQSKYFSLINSYFFVLRY